MFFGSRFSVTLLRNLADFTTEIYFGCEKPEHANAPIVQHYVMRNREEKYTQ